MKYQRQKGGILLSEFNKNNSFATFINYIKHSKITKLYNGAFGITFLLNYKSNQSGGNDDDDDDPVEQMVRNAQKRANDTLPPPPPSQSVALSPGTRNTNQNA
jgi:hypothetical protein